MPLLSFLYTFFFSVLSFIDCCFPFSVFVLLLFFVRSHRFFQYSFHAVKLGEQLWCQCNTVSLSLCLPSTSMKFLNEKMEFVFAVSCALCVCFGGGGGEGQRCFLLLASRKPMYVEISLTYYWWCSAAFFFCACVTDGLFCPWPFPTRNVLLVVAILVFLHLSFRLVHSRLFFKS